MKQQLCIFTSVVDTWLFDVQKVNPAAKGFFFESFDSESNSKKKTFQIPTHKKLFVYNDSKYLKYKYSNRLIR